MARIMITFYSIEKWKVQMKRSLFSLGFIFCLNGTLSAQENFTQFSGGYLSKFNTSFDVISYDLNLKFRLNEKSIYGYNKISFKNITNTNIDTIKIDLKSPFLVDKIVDDKNQTLNFFRKDDAMLIFFKNSIPPQSISSLTIFYHGIPPVAKNAPWDGGFVWNKDRNLEWVAVAIQENGASMWYPCKDHVSDKIDSTTFTLQVPKPYKAVSNGKLVDQKDINDSVQYTWKVSYPMNMYNLTFYIGDYAYFNEPFKGIKDEFLLEYYVLSPNLEKAKKHFQQIPEMLQVFEEYLGPFPFPKDNYKLVEAPYGGMEHQTAIGYGNKFMPGYWGYDLSEQGLDFDFIALHESLHEYWGNSVTMQETRDFWINEGLCTFSEMFYVEKKYGKDKAIVYANAWKKRVENRHVLVGEKGKIHPYNIDAYYKGALMMFTLRNLVNNDTLFISMMKAIQVKFAKQNVSSETLTAFMSDQLGEDYSWLFQEYLYKNMPPRFGMKYIQKGKNLIFSYRWKHVSEAFKLPVHLLVKGEKIKLYPTTQWQEIILKNTNINDIVIDDSDSYFIVLYEQG